MDIDLDDIGEDEYYVRPRTSIRRYDLPPLSDAVDDPETQPGPVIRRRRSAINPESQVSASRTTTKAMTPPVKMPSTLRLRLGERLRHIRGLPLLAGLMGMLMTLLLIVSFNAIGNWWQIHQDDVTYGRPRTFQIDAVVGHNDSPANPSHFIFMNLNRHVIIIEFPGGDPSHARIYSGPTLFGNGQDLTPVTAEFKDVNGDGKLDMIVMIQNQRLVYINTGTAFRPLQPGEQVNLPPS
jgi:hypothetical protein